MPTDDAAQPPLVPEAPPRLVGLIIAIHRNADDIGPCLDSVFADADGHPEIELTVVVVDDASVDAGPDLVADRFPRADLLRLPDNLGFAGANNAGYDRLREVVPGLEFVALLNADTVVRPGWLAALVAFLDAHADAGAAQPKILLHDEPHLINTVGNRIHYLGFGMMTAYREPDDGRFDSPNEIAFPSGCAVLLRADWLAEHGLFDPAFDMYLEDADLGLRLLATGRPAWYCPTAAVLHRYTPDAPTKAYRLLERNRYRLLLTYWPWSLLLAVSPMLMLMEAMQWGYAVTIGRPLARVYLWRDLMFNRHPTDRSLPRMKPVNPSLLVDRIELPDGGPRLLDRVVNPLLAATAPAGCGHGTPTATAREAQAGRSIVAGLVFQSTYIVAHLIILAVLFREVGEEQFGMWVTIFGLTMWMNLLPLGMNRAILTWLGASGADRPRHTWRAIEASMTVVGAVCLVAVAALAIVGPMVNWAAFLNVSSDAARAIAAPTALWALIVAAASMPAAMGGMVLQSMQRGMTRHLLGVVAQLIGLAMLLIGIWLDWTLPVLGVIVVSPILLAGLMQWIAAWRILPPRPRSQTHAESVILPLLRSGIGLWIIEGAIVLTIHSGPLLVAQWMGAADVARYAATHRLVGPMVAVFLVASQSYWPAFSDAARAGDRAWLIRGLWRSAALLAGIWAGGSVVCLAIGKPFVRWWLGPDAEPSLTLIATGLALGFTLGLYYWTTAALSGFNAVRPQVIGATGGLFLYALSVLALWNLVGGAGVFLLQALGIGVFGVANACVLARWLARPGAIP
ncbi:MAG: glycosyltransferase [Planctomycetota bacterium]